MIPLLLMVIMAEIAGYAKPEIQSQSFLDVSSYFQQHRRVIASQGRIIASVILGMINYHAVLESVYVSPNTVMMRHDATVSQRQ